MLSPNAAFYQVGVLYGSSSFSSSPSSYAVNFNSKLFYDGDVNSNCFRGFSKAAYKASKISHLGVMMDFTVSDKGGTYAFSKSESTILYLSPFIGNHLLIGKFPQS
jgi:hypothetical protein